MIPRWLGRALERGAVPALEPAGALISRLSSASLREVSPLSRLPSWGVFGSTLGGSFRTPVAIALCQRFVLEGARPVLVGHGYGGTTRRARVVSSTDRVTEVGDEALLAARALSVPVVVAPTWRAAIRLAETLGDLLVLDGSHRAHERVLSLDAAAPWGSRRRFPVGDLRASPAWLLEASTYVARVRAEVDVPVVEGPVAVVTCIARPSRFVRSLSDLPISRVVELPDHGGPDAGRRAERALAGARFDVVLCTEKCASSLPARLLGRPVLPVAMTPHFRLERASELANASSLVARSP